MVVHTLLFVLLLLVPFSQQFSGADKILLTDVKALTLHKDQMTTARRTSPISQLKCIGGNAAHSSHHPSVVQCQNVGHDGHDVQWNCQADLDETVKFGRVIVNCEGYSNSNDPYVLRGSCGMEYTLEYTRKGQQQGHQFSYNDQYYDSNGSGWGNFFTFIVLVAIIFGILRACSSTGAVYRADGSQGGPYGGAPHGGGPYGGGYGGPYGGGSYGGTYGTCPPSTPNAGGGFWSGLATGGLLSYLFSRPSYGYGYNQYGGFGTGYGAGYGGGYGGYRRTWGTTGFGGTNSGGGSRMASGFGGTQRR